MSRTIDIREENSYNTDEVIAITFTDRDSFMWRDAAVAISRKPNGRVWVHSYDAHVSIYSIEDVSNLIKALEKAIELEWVK